jgi:hypothetical protein
MRLTFPNGEHPAIDVPEGELGIGSGDGNRVSVQGAGLAATHVRLTRDHKGLWLRVPEGGGSVHVNARPVHALAMLRPGDLLCLGHLQAQVSLARESVRADADGQAPLAMAGVRIVLRGVSGAFSGRSFSLRERLVLGGGAGVDVRLDDPALSDSRVEITLDGARVVLKVAGGDAVHVNGLPCRDALLEHGDQLVMEQQRFVLEAPGLARHAELGPDDEATTVQEQPARRADTASTVWWLMAAATTLAAILTALLLYGPGRG